jgi:hypothetical protein
MNPILFVLLMASFNLTQANEVKDSLRKTPVNVREEWLKKASVFDKNFTTKFSNENLSQLDLAELVEKTCGENFPYLRDPKGNFIWPQVTCQYQPSAKVLGGSTNKFLCNFKETNKKGEVKVKTRKVKYLAFTGIKNSELVPTLLAGYAAKLMGFPSDLYCPAQIECENCSSNMPYEFGKGQGHPSQETFSFPNAMVEFSPSFSTVEPDLPRPNARRAHGVKPEEMLFSVAESKQSIDRQVWLLWLNFIIESDPIPSNNKLVCRSGELTESNQVNCVDPMIYTTDYGQAFYRRFQFENWNKTPALKQVEEGVCRTGMDFELFKTIREWKDTKPWLGVTIHREAQEKFLGRIKSISDAQWLDIARFANIHRLYKVTPEQFLSAVRERISQIEAIRCQ